MRCCKKKIKNKNLIRDEHVSMLTAAVSRLYPFSVSCRSFHHIVGLDNLLHEKRGRDACTRRSSAGDDTCRKEKEIRRQQPRVLKKPCGSQGRRKREVHISTPSSCLILVYNPSPNFNTFYITTSNS